MKLDVVCLYEQSGLSADEWARNGYSVYCYDILHASRSEQTVGQGRKVFMPWDARNLRQCNDVIHRHKGSCAIVLAYPPCTDLAVSGAVRFAAKRARNPNYREEAMDLVYTARDMAERLKAPWCIENPVSVISSQWRKPDYIFHPYEYGGYLPENDVHPLYPEYIEPRDAYPKKTCYWTGNGFIMPRRRPVPFAQGYSKQYRLLGGKSERTKRIRSASPRGINVAIYRANAYAAHLHNV